MTVSYFLKRISPKWNDKWLGFKEDYTQSNRYGHSQLVATIFWIGSTIGHIVIDPVGFVPGPKWLSEYFTQLSLAVVALLFLLCVFPGWHIYKEKPFNFRVDWYPLSHKTNIHKSKRENKLQLSRQGELKIVTPMKIIGNRDKYTFELRTSNREKIRFTVDEYNGDQSINTERNKLTSENIVHEEFLNILDVEKLDDLGGGSDHYVRIVDVKEEPEETKENEVLHIDVRE